YLRDYGKLPHLAELPPHEPGMSLPELIGPRLRTPNVVFCPSDETDRSQVLGTSYRWATAFNGLEFAGLDRALDQPLLQDREAFHLGTDRASNELLLRKEKGMFQFIVTGSTEEQVQDASPGKNNAKPNKGKGNNN